MTALRFLQEFVEQYVLLHIKRQGNPIFQQENARTHVARNRLIIFAAAHVNIFIMATWNSRSLVYIGCLLYYS